LIDPIPAPMTSPALRTPSPRGKGNRKMSVLGLKNLVSLKKHFSCWRGFIIRANAEVGYSTGRRPAAAEANAEKVGYSTLNARNLQNRN